MSDLKEAGHIMRIGVMAFMLPIWALATALFIWNGDYLFAGLMIFFGALMGYGVYMNWKRIASDEKIDDERMQQVNWKSGFSAFWAMINTAIFASLFQGILSGVLPISERQLMMYDATAILGVGFISYFAFRTYYLKFGLETGFWKVT